MNDRELDELLNTWEAPPVPKWAGLRAKLQGKQARRVLGRRRWILLPGAAVARSRFRPIDRQLPSFGEELPPGDVPEPERVRLLERMAGAVGGRWWAFRWLPALVGVLAGAVLLTVSMPHSSYRIADPVGPQFVEIPYVPPLAPDERARVVPMQIQIASLMAVGYRVSGDPTAVVQADVLVGEDGRAHAVRIPSDHLGGIGD